MAYFEISGVKLTLKTSFTSEKQLDNPPLEPNIFSQTYSQFDRGRGGLTIVRRDSKFSNFLVNWEVLIN